jgi:hypothetical protein
LVLLKPPLGLLDVVLPEASCDVRPVVLLHLVLLKPPLVLLDVVLPEARAA